MPADRRPPSDARRAAGARPAADAAPAADARHAPLIRAVIIGVTGRMGRSLMHAAPAFPQLIITGAIASPDSLALGRDVGEVAGTGSANLAVTSDLPRALAQADVALDFSSAAATSANLAACRAARTPLLLGTTGFGAALADELTRAASDIPLLVAANTSVAVALLVELTRAAARALPGSFDIDVLELHHRLKPDAPSGTALALGNAAAQGRAAAVSSAADSGAGVSGPGASGPALTGAAVSPAAARLANPLSRTGPRPEGEIGFAALRAGDIVGEHTVLFSGPGEELALTHRARDRAVFARGALAAALWLSSRPPGRYGMGDFLGVKTST